MKQKRFNVTFSISYKVTASKRSEAIDKAEQLFVVEIENLDCGLTEIFNAKVEEESAQTEGDDKMSDVPLETKKAVIVKELEHLKQVIDRILNGLKQL